MAAVTAVVAATAISAGVSIHQGNKNRQFMEEQSALQNEQSQELQNQIQAQASAMADEYGAQADQYGQQVQSMFGSSPQYQMSQTYQDTQNLMQDVYGDAVTTGQESVQDISALRDTLTGKLETREGDLQQQADAGLSGYTEAAINRGTRRTQQSISKLMRSGNVKDAYALVDRMAEQEGQAGFLREQSMDIKQQNLSSFMTQNVAAQQGLAQTQLGAQQFATQAQMNAANQLATANQAIGQQELLQFQTNQLNPYQQQLGYYMQGEQSAQNAALQAQLGGMGANVTIGGQNMANQSLLAGNQLQANSALAAGFTSGMTNMVGAVGASGGFGGAPPPVTPPPGSDRRLKKNINKIGESSSGLNIYAFEYIDEKYGSGTFQGVMSDEAPQEAVVVGVDGYDRVDYSKIDVDFKQL
jgi:hypothetical protein